MASAATGSTIAAQARIASPYNPCAWKVVARRKKTSLLEDLIELVALMPWWAGVAIAVVGYLWLHDLAARPLTAARPGELVSGNWWRAIATAAQYIVPVVGLLSGRVRLAASATNRSGRRRGR